MPFKILRDVADPDLVRVQQNVQAALQELGASSSKSANVVATPPQYRCTGAEDVVFVDQLGGRVTVVLPERPTHSLTVKSISDSTNAVSIMAPGVAPGGTAPEIDGASLLALDPNESVRLAFDGRAWWTL